MLPAQPNQSLIEGIRCLQALSLSEKPLRSIEVSRLLKVESTKAHRLLKTLAHLGLVHQGGNRKFQVGPGLPVLVAQSLYSAPLWRSMVDPLQDLQRQIPSCKVEVGMCWEGVVSCFYCSEPGMPASWAMGRVDMQMATRSAIGLALLSCCSQEKVEETFIGRPIPGFSRGLPSLVKELRTIRSQGYALIPDGQSGERFSLAVPQEDKLYALALSGDLSKEDIPELVQLLQHTLELLYSAHNN